MFLSNPQKVLKNSTTISFLLLFSLKWVSARPNSDLLSYAVTGFLMNL